MGEPDVRKPRQPSEFDPDTFSNGIRLTGREWLAVGLFAVLLVAFAPALWKQKERFAVEPDYRMPHELSNDYWLFERWAGLAAAQHDTLLIGDSVIWGEYVTPTETLSHYLNEVDNLHRCANLGLDGVFPLALGGQAEGGQHGVEQVFLEDRLGEQPADVSVDVRDHAVEFGQVRGR